MESKSVSSDSIQEELNIEVPFTMKSKPFPSQSVIGSPPSYPKKKYFDFCKPLLLLNFYPNDSKIASRLAHGSGGEKLDKKHSSYITESKRRKIPFMQEFSIVNFVGILGKIAIFKNRFKKKLFLSRLENLDSKQRKFINDLADWDQDHQEEGSKFWLSRLIEIVFSQSNIFLVFHNITLLTFVLIKFFTLSLDLFFFQTKIFSVLNLPLGIFLLLDIFLKFNTSFFKKGILINNRIKICRDYIKGRLAFDLIAIIPLFCEVYNQEDPPSHPLLFENPIGNSLLLLFYLKIPTVVRIFEQIEEILVQQNPYREELLSLIVLIFKVISIIHFLACSWNILAEIERAENNLCWWDDKKINPENRLDKYIYAFYFVTTTLVSVGFGDITPKTTREVCMGIVTMLLSCCFLGYFIGNVNQLLNKLNSRFRKKKEDIRLLTNILKQKTIEVNLQHKIIKYLDYVWKEEEMIIAEKRLNFVEKLSKNLKEEYLLQTSGRTLRKCKVFQNNFSENTMRALVHIMEPRKFAEDEMIFEAGEVDNDKIFIVHEGQIELYINCKKKGENTRISLLEAGDTFGETSFFHSCELNHSVRSLSSSSVFALSRSNFLEIIKNNQEDLETFCYLRDNLHIYNNYDNLKMTCSFCYESNHQVVGCPYVHKPLNRDLVMKKFLHNTNQERRVYKRRHLKKTKQFHFVIKSPFLELQYDGSQTNYCPSENSEEEIASIGKIEREASQSIQVKMCLGEETWKDDMSHYEEMYLREKTLENRHSKEHRDRGHQRESEYRLGKTLEVPETNSESYQKKFTRQSGTMADNTNCLSGESLDLRTFTVRTGQGQGAELSTPKKKKQELFLYNMDRALEFVKYYPHNNVGTVLSYFHNGRYAKKMKLRGERVQKMNRLSFANAMTQQQNQMKYFKKNKSKLESQLSPFKKLRRSIWSNQALA